MPLFYFETPPFKHIFSFYIPVETFGNLGDLSPESLSACQQAFHNFFFKNLASPWLEAASQSIRCNNKMRLKN